MRNTVVMVDDDQLMELLFTRAFSEHGIRLVSARTGSGGVEAALRESPCAVLLDLRLPDTDGIAVLKHLRRRNCDAPVIFMTSYGNSQIRLETQADGKTTYLEKPLDTATVVDFVRRSLGKAPLYRRAIVGRSPALEEAMNVVERLAATDLPVLIEGESGTGKELVAQVLHSLSARRDGPLVVFDPSTVPESLLESELFGHEKGAFTGATERRQGKFEAANGGTLVVDEIGNLPYGVQGKLLRILQERSFCALGSSRVVNVDVRVVSSTNVDLAEAVKRGTFRLDVYHRLKGARIYLPPLRRRREDIPDLVDHFLALENQATVKSVTGVRPAALELLLAYGWPGNVRELANAVRFAHCMARDEIGPRDLCPEIRETTTAAAPFDLLNVEVLDQVISAAASRGTLDLKAVLEDLRKRVEDRVLGRLIKGRSQAAVASMLGLDPGTLSRKLRCLRTSLSQGVRDGPPKESRGA